MIPTFSHKATSRSSANTSSYTLTSVSWEANRIILVAIGAAVTTGPITTPTLTVTGLTFTLISSIANAATNRKLFLFRALTASASSGAIAADFSGQTQSNCEWSIVEVTDSAITGTNGADAIVQSKATMNDTAASSYSISFDGAYGGSENRAFGAFASNSAEAVFQAGTNFTVAGQTQGSGSNAGLATEYGRDSDTAVDMSFISGTSAWRAVIVEIAAGATPVGPTTFGKRSIRMRPPLGM